MACTRQVAAVRLKGKQRRWLGGLPQRMPRFSTLHTDKNKTRLPVWAWTVTIGTWHWLCFTSLCLLFRWGVGEGGNIWYSVPRFDGAQLTSKNRENATARYAKNSTKQSAKPSSVYELYYSASTTRRQLLLHRHPCLWPRWPWSCKMPIKVAGWLTTVLRTH